MAARRLGVVCVALYNKGFVMIIDRREFFKLGTAYFFAPKGGWPVPRRVYSFKDVKRVLMASDGPEGNIKIYTSMKEIEAALSLPWRSS
jgi:hypothetical protein